MVTDEMKRGYARLIIKQGLNLQRGQRLLCSCPVECADFARLCVSEAYAAGCREAVVHWSDDAILREYFLHADDDVFDVYDPAKTLLYNSMSDEGAAFLSIYSEDPENLAGIDSDRLRRYELAGGSALKPFRVHETRNDMQWCVASVPCKAWAKKVFPDLSEAEADDKLWQAILSASHADGDDPESDWRAHTETLKKRVETLNSLNFRYLHYTNSLGTDLTVELPEGHFWSGGSEAGRSGVVFSANIPSEEVFTLPKRDGVNGIVYGTKPLALSGNLVTGFYFRVKDGKIVEVHAEQNEEILKNAVTLDEGSSYFGEVALVPYDSPISNSGILFYNMLFDENASCHIAFGEAYPCIYGAEDMTDDELKARGVNYSMSHEDFMVGTPDLSIVGVTHDGRHIQIFTDGNFAL